MRWLCARMGGWSCPTPKQLRLWSATYEENQALLSVVQSGFQCIRPTQLFLTLPTFSEAVDIFPMPLEWYVCLIFHWLPSASSAIFAGC